MLTEIIVEIGNSHEGSLGIAKSFVDIAKEAGANVVKFQMHLAEEESSSEEPFRINFSSQDKSRTSYWQRVNFSPEHWYDLAEYCRDAGLEFLCTPFSLEAARFLIEELDVKRIKIGSGDAMNYPLIDFVIKSGREVIISTGLVNQLELSSLVERFKEKSTLDVLTLLHCVSMYPTPLAWSSLNQIVELKKLGCKVGLSDHSGNVMVPLAFISEGVSLIEVHMTPHRSFFGPDVASSLLPEEIKMLIDFSKTYNALVSNSRIRDEIFNESINTAQIFRKGTYWRNDLRAGHIIEFSDLKFLKPLNDFDANSYEDLIGCKLISSVMAGTSVVKGQISEKK